QRLRRHVDVLLHGAREAADGRALDDFADLLHGLEVAGRRYRESGLDHIYAEELELPRDLQLLLDVQRRARRLLAVPQRGIENVDSGWHNVNSSEMPWHRL